MALAPQFEQLVLDNGSANYKETIFHVPDSHTEKEYGSFLFSIEIPEGPDGSKKLSRFLQKTFATNFYSDLNNDPHESLEKASQLANEEIAKTAATFGEWVWRANIVIAVFSQNELHISTSGHGALYLIRSNQIVDVAEGLADGNAKAEQKLFFSVASGQLEEGDVCVASTNDLSRFIKPKKLAAVVSGTLHDGIRTGKDIVSAILKELALPDKQLLSLSVVYLSTLAQLTAQAEAAASRLAFLFRKSKVWLHHLGQGISSLAANKTTTAGASQLSINKPGPQLTWRSRLKKTWHMVRSKQGLKEAARSLDMSLPQQKRQRRALITTAIICLLILLGAIGVINKNRQANDERLMKVFNEMSSDRQAAETRRLFDKEGARRLLNNASKLGKQLDEAGFRPTEVSGEIVKVNLLLDDISDVSRVSNIKVYNDLKNIAKRASPKGLLYQDGNLYVYENANLYKVLLDKIERYPLLTTNEEIIAATQFQYRNSFLFLTNGGKLYEFKDNAVKEVAHPGEGTWPLAQAMVEYSESRNIYMLDSAKNEVWAYRATATGFAGPTRKNVVKSDLSESLSLAVDGNLYVLKTGGKVIKTYGGSPRAFAFESLPDGLGETTKISTGLAQDHVYFLFPQKRSIIKTDKRGAYLKQYLIDDPSFSIPVDFQADEALGKIFAVDSSGKIIEVPL